MTQNPSSFREGSCSASEDSPGLHSCDRDGGGGRWSPTKPWMDDRAAVLLLAKQRTSQRARITSQRARIEERLRDKVRPPGALPSRRVRVPTHDD